MGCSELEATRIAERLAGANLRGHDSHGVIRAPRYANYIVEGTQIPNVTVDIKIENETLAVIDGKFGFGQTVGEQAVDIGIKKAIIRKIINKKIINICNPLANFNIYILNFISLSCKLLFVSFFVLIGFLL